MFTGIIEALGRIEAVDSVGGDRRLRVSARDYLHGVRLGDSIAVNGVCLTAVALGERDFSADISAETLSATTAALWQAGDAVNLERALTAEKPLGGHFVSGHVDGLARLIEKHEDARSWRLLFEAPPPLARYIARKGSVTLDGISLTVNEVKDALTPPGAPRQVPPSPATQERDISRPPSAAGCIFGVNIVPHTWTHTTLGARAVGDAVNLEVDLVARYLERLLAARNET